MIIFNKVDFNLGPIARESRLEALITRYRYRIYGSIQKEKNPSILIEYHFGKTDQKFKTNLDSLCLFFGKNKIECGINCEFEKNYIDIGLRRDFRENLIFSSKILRTIIFGLEGKINLEELKNYKI